MERNQPSTKPAAGQSAYLLLSRHIGFDWRLFPERWVSIMLNSQPWLSGGPGLIEHYPWIATGIAGILASAYAARAKIEFKPSLLLGFVSITQLVVYLCYRDLHPTGLFAYGNQHYFKGFIAISVLFSIVLIDLCFRTKVDRGVALLAIIFVAALLPWRLVFINSELSQVVSDNSGYELSGGFKNIDSGFWFNQCGQYPVGKYPTIGMRIGNIDYRPVYDFKPYPVAGGFLVLPVRKLPNLTTEISINCTGGAAPSDATHVKAYAGQLAFKLF